MRIAIYVQHLLGSGHLVRMRQLADALTAAGQQVTLISGGLFTGTAAFNVIQLPPLHTEPGDFGTLLDAEGTAVDGSWKSDRCEKLVSDLQQLKPDLLVIETWPFGRRQMEFEILPMLTSLQGLNPAPRVVCSIRDVLQARREKRRQETLERIKQFISLVLVHGDAAVMDLSASFPEYREITSEVIYTGYIGAPGHSMPVSPSAGEILVSAGGGAAGVQLLQVAIAAADKRTDQHWRILVGPRISDAAFHDWQLKAGANVVVERNRPDFGALLRACAVSVSQLGYNTAMDLLQARCAAVVVPYAEDGETEQQTRAMVFADKGFVTMLPASDLNADTLLRCIDVARPPASACAEVKMDGAATSARIICQYFENQS